MKYKSLAIQLLALLLITGCKYAPQEKLRQAELEASYTIEGKKLNFTIGNPLKCPIRINATSEGSLLSELLESHFPMVITPQTDTLISYTLPDSSLQKDKITLSFVLGAISTDSLEVLPLQFPFPKGRKYRIIQGYNGSYSHRSDYSRYAIDFNMAEGDTVCAAADGYVVGVIEGYKYGGSSKKWRDYANFITLYHPAMNRFTQYVHLKHEGSFVEVGDFVEQGEAIGLSGNTGYTNTEHLHFNVLIPTENSMISAPTSFTGDIDGAELKRGVTVHRRLED